jgi:CRISPR-associated endonuclease/helicase Cas3
MMERALGKAERLLQIEALLLAHPEGLSQAEIARKLGVNRSTIHRYLPELTTRFYVYEEDDGRLAIDRDRYLTQVRLTIGYDQHTCNHYLCTFLTTPPSRHRVARR